ncbi:MAG: flagellar biosynthesis protein FlgM [Henriciella sp.]|uniref:KPN_02809 family neutral zinc metallopeptidase n=1 Tax=Henriciella sp. TaxID=1968823 RepID=UPI000C0F09AB|nr:neutral zinc metallopeptidase [Henriciella sp.]MAN74317.1 flagellar biosynthesis protein FlgM [Henriciella sp.]MBF34526.1 flagellar biosynthesis protein FlgM [Hyphomonadaceae bacterium]PHR83154.1 MAG: flagellar biosynthesis protein FlgM [Henriciella sp.]
MKWKGGRRGGRVEDRRGMKSAAAGGGLGVIVLALAGYFFFGIDPQTTQQIASQFGGAGTQERGDVGTPEDEAGLFVDVVGSNINDVWSGLMDGYTPPNTVLYTQGTNTGCGYGQAAMGPFYCPSDQTVYLDLSFWRQMETELGASGADFAKAYVIGHEFGHHVQTLTGASQKVRDAQQRAGSQAEANEYTVALELQADCYAGVWAANASAASGGRVALEEGDIEEGLRTASAIGDDALQRRAGRNVNPESFTHGSSAQRKEWLLRGYQTGNPNSCDTFASL